MPLSSTAIDAQGRPIDPATYRQIRGARKLPPLRRYWVYRRKVRVFDWPTGPLDYTDLQGFQLTKAIKLAQWREAKEKREFERLVSALKRRARRAA